MDRFSRLRDLSHRIRISEYSRRERDGRAGSAQNDHFPKLAVFVRGGDFVVAQEPANGGVALSIGRQSFTGSWRILGPILGPILGRILGPIRRRIRRHAAHA